MTVRPSVWLNGARGWKALTDDIVLFLPVLMAFALMVFAFAVMLYHARPA
jgi:hypothetical protein